MGCDIHIITEIRKDGKWKRVPEIPNTVPKNLYDALVETGVVWPNGFSFEKIADIYGVAPEDIRTVFCFGN